MQAPVKRTHYIRRVGIGLALATLSVAWLADCAKPKKKEAPTVTLLVLFRKGDVKVLRGTKQEELKANAGTMLMAGDRIETATGASLDVQTREGTALRVRQKTSISIEELAGRGQGANRFTLKKGSLFANAKKTAASESFAVRTPTAIASVRGTSFSVSVNDKGERPKVRVLKGKVALSPRIAALEKLSPEKIQADEKLRKLAALSKKEVTLEKNSEGALPKRLESQLAGAGKDIAAGRSPKAAPNEDSAKSMRARKIRPTATERLDQATLIIVDEGAFDKISKNPDAASQELSRLDKMREQQRLEELQKLAREALSAAGARPQNYGKIVTVLLKDGTRVKGTILNRAEGSMILRTSGDVKLIQLADVAKIE